MAIEKLSTNSLAKALDKKDSKFSDSRIVDADIATADAYDSIIKAEEKTVEVLNELDKAAESVILEAPEAPEVKEKNIYTSVNLTLDESVERDDDDEDPYLDYDMFYFVYGLAVAEDWPRPRNPLGRPMRKFQYTGSDDYMKTNSNKGVPQVSTDDNGNVVVYADNVSDFDDIRAVCKFYNIEAGSPKSRMSSDSKWKFSCTIKVPSINGVPMLAEDFFAEQGLSLSDVMEEYDGGKANWGRTQEKRVQKDLKQGEEMVNDHAVEDTFKKYVHLAGSSYDPLEGFINDMFKELDAAGRTYSKRALKKRFMDEFDDDFEDEE